MVPGEGTRPLGDRPKGALFSILGDFVQGARVLDLFAGTGSVGIEALSRGAEMAVFVDLRSVAIRTIQENLNHTKLSKRSRVLQADAFRFLEGPVDLPFDMIYVAPPQHRGMWLRALRLLDAHPNWLVPDGVVVVQIDPAEQEEVSLESLLEYDRRRYGSTVLIFYEYPGE